MKNIVITIPILLLSCQTVLADAWPPTEEMYPQYNHIKHQCLNYEGWNVDRKILENIAKIQLEAEFSRFRGMNIHTEEKMKVSGTINNRSANVQQDYSSNTSTTSNNFLSGLDTFIRKWNGDEFCIAIGAVTSSEYKGEK